MSGHTLRKISSDELPALTSKLSMAGITPDHALLLERSGRVMVAGSIETCDRNLESTLPRLRFCLIDPEFDLQSDLPVLLERLITQVAAEGFDRLLIGWDPMDHHGLKALEALGFRPSGEMPYFVVGPGQIQYVSGYQDATGSTLDLVIKLPQGVADPEA